MGGWGEAEAAMEEPGEHWRQVKHLGGMSVNPWLGWLEGRGSGTHDDRTANEWGWGGGGRGA
jgi:hypothetical protein